MSTLSNSTKPTETGTTRRAILQAGPAVMGLAAFSSFFKEIPEDGPGVDEPDPVGGPNVRWRFSVCQNCHSRCGLLGTVVDGVLVKLDGNPYHPNNMEEDERLPYATPASVAAATRGRLCPKGQSGVQVLYDPWRIKHPLKRVGPRGSGQWQAISWSQAFSEIAARIDSLIPTASRLTTLIDPAVPELGPIANQLLFCPGRSTDGEIIERIFKNTYGTANYRLDHTSICEQNHHVHNELMTWDEAANKGRKNHFKPDLAEAEFVILFGSNYLEANFPMLALSRRTVAFKKRGGKLAVVDPRFSNTAAKADWWVPAKPGTDAAVALGIAWTIMDSLPAATSAFLRNANAAAAAAAGEKSWTDATRLVITAVSGSVPAGAVPGEYLRVQDYLPTSQPANTNKVALVSSSITEIGTAAVVGDLLGSLTLDSSNSELAAGASITVKSVYQILKERVYDGKSVAYYAGIAGVEEQLLVNLANEFMAHGKKSVANHYRGTVQHTNGLYAAGSVQLLNMLAGNFDWRGGYAIGGGSYSYNAGMKGTSYSTSGPSINRVKVSPDFYAGLVAAHPSRYSWPAQRPWFPFGTHGNYQEVIPSAHAGYPYPVKVLITYWNAWPYSTPALKSMFEQTVADPDKIPLFVAIDKDMGETSSWADYILPDTSYLEKWSFPGMTPTILTKATSFRQPLVGTFDDRTWDAPFDPNANNDYKPIYPDTKMFEDILISLMAALGLTTDIGGTPLPARAWDHVKIGVQNLAASTGTTVQEVIEKGGVFEDPGNSYSGNYLKYVYANELRIWSEQVAGLVDSMGDGTTRFDGLLPHFEPVADVRGNPIDDAAYPLQLITYKSVLHGQARTAALPWLTGILAENFVEMNPADAEALGLANLDRVRISSASAPAGLVGRVKVTPCIRPGVVAVSHHLGHWQLGSSPRTEDGVEVAADPSRGRGIQANPIMRLDPYLGDVTLQDRIGCSAAFNDTRVKVEKIA
ncbi:MAG: tetrathionate reductase subunit TtrA [Planctomycetota bacterium]